MAKKNPSVATFKGRPVRSKQLQNIGSRKRAVFLAHYSSACLLQQRAGQKLNFANSTTKIAIGPPSVNLCGPL
jgi:hypothetical protein